VDVCDTSSSKTNKVNVCDVCLRAQQPRNQFYISESIADDLFELIHCDIWSSYKIPSFCGAHHFFRIVDDASRAIYIDLMRD